MRSIEFGRVVFREGKRLYLRPPAVDDVHHLVRWLNDYRVNRTLSSRLPVTETEEKEWVENRHQYVDQQIALLVVVKGQLPTSDSAIGIVQLNQIDREGGTAQEGVAIGEPEYWNQGYGTEATMLVLEFAFNTLNLRKIYSHVISTNAGIIRHNEKCGFVHEATLPAHHFREGEYVDELIFAVYANSWRKLWRKMKGRIIDKKGG